MKQPGLDQRHRDKNGELSDVLHALDEPSLSKLVRDHQAGTLEGKIKQHS